MVATAATPYKGSSAYAAIQSEKSNENAKREQRKYLHAFFDIHHTPDRPLRFLGLPGLAWEFENGLLKQFGPDSFFVAAECIPDIFDQSRRWIPSDEEYDYPTVQLVQQKRYAVIRSMVTARALSLNTTMSQLVDLISPGNELSEAGGNINALWLDFTGNISGKEIQWVLKNIPLVLDPDVKQVPFAVSICKSREKKGTRFGRTSDKVYRRVAIVTELLESSGLRYCNLVRPMETQTTERTKMITVKGVLQTYGS